MKDRQPWSVRGVTREARAKAARAAAHGHLTIGEWVTQVLVAAADRDLGVAADQPAADTKANLPATGGSSDNELAGAIGALVQHLQKSTPEVQVSDIARRLDHTEHALVGRMEQMAAGLYSLMQTVENRAMPVIDANDRPIMLPDQSRLAAAVEKMANSEARRQDQMDAVAEALTLLAAKVGNSPNPASPAGQQDDELAVDGEHEDEPEDEPTTPANDTPSAPANDTDGPRPIRVAQDDTEEAETASTAEVESPEDDALDSTDEVPTAPEPPRKMEAAARIASSRDERGGDVIAAIRARGSRPELAESHQQSRRGLLDRLFGRD